MCAVFSFCSVNHKQTVYKAAYFHCRMFRVTQEAWTPMVFLDQYSPARARSPRPSGGETETFSLQLRVHLLQLLVYR
jgi:hypothetical protein